MNQMSEAVREEVIAIAKGVGLSPVLKPDGRDQYVKVLMFRVPNHRHHLFITKQGIATNSVGRPRYYQVVVHPDVFQSGLVDPDHGVTEMQNRKTGINLFASSNYSGFPRYPDYGEPCGKCYRAEGFAALERLLSGLAKKRVDRVHEPSASARINEERAASASTNLEPMAPLIQAPMEPVPPMEMPESTTSKSRPSGRCIPTSALIIDSPYIDHILRGDKTWEMRSRKCAIRGTIGLIRKGSGTVVGVAEVVGNLGPLSPDEMLANLHKHRIPPDLLKDEGVAKWNMAWVLEGVQAFATPVRYSHPHGAVIWVTLDEETRGRIARELALPR